MLEETIPTISSWFTPTFLFLALNLVIGIIAITSIFGSKHKQHPLHHHPLQPQHDNSRGFQTPLQQQESRGGVGGGGSSYQQPQLVRGPSTVIERLKSINLYHFKTEDLNPFSSIHNFHQPDPVPVSSGFVSSENQYVPPPPPQQQQQQQRQYPQQQQPLARAPSILERLKSINLYHYKSEDFNPFHSNIHESEYQEEETTQQRKLQSARNSKDRDFLDHRALDNKKSKVKVVQQHDTQQHQQSPAPPAQKQRAAAAPLARAPPAPPPLVRAPSILERLKSINLYPDFIPFQKQPVDQFPDQDDYLDHRALEKKKSGTKNTLNPQKKKLVRANSDALAHFGEFDGHQDEDEFLDEKRRNLSAKEKKSKSMNVKKVNEFSDDEEGRVVDEEVDAKADDFINRFKNQLKLQRLDSIMQYKDLLTNKK